MKKFLTSLLLLIFTIHISPAQSFYLEYLEPTEEDWPYAQMVVESGIFDEVVADLEALFALPHPIKITFGSNLPGPQYFQQVINMPYSFLKYHDEVLTAVGFTDDPEEMVATLLNLTEFVLYHEVGHALVDILDIPVLGKHEDAVDGFAALLATIWDLEDVAHSAAEVMDATSSMTAGTEITDAEFWDEHSLDEQRMYAILCLIYGSDPEGNADLPIDLDWPEEKSAKCLYDYQETFRNWTRVLEGYIRE